LFILFSDQHNGCFSNQPLLQSQGKKKAGPLQFPASPDSEYYSMCISERGHQDKWRNCANLDGTVDIIQKSVKRLFLKAGRESIFLREESI
jgi:hypothetical protein